MMKNEVLKSFGIVIVLILLIAVSLYILVNYIKPKKIAESTIFDYFSNNYSNFNDSLYELQKYDNIYFNNEHGKINISIHINQNKNILVEKINASEYKNFEITLNLMKNLNLSRVSKEYGNVSFELDSPIYFHQKIVNINDQEKYSWGYHILYTKKIINNWYYVETK